MDTIQGRTQDAAGEAAATRIRRFAAGTLARRHGAVHGDWVEGPSVAQVGAEWIGAMGTKDWKTFEPVDVNFPTDHRHGTVVKIPEAVAQALRAQ